MKHPFDDFLPPSWHQKRADRQLIRLGTILVAVVSISTAVAFASTIVSWRNLLVNNSGVEVRWDDAKLRVDAYLRAQKELARTIESATQIEQYTDGVPRSLLLWEITELLPEHTKLEDVRLETRKRSNNDSMEISELITLLGLAPNDVSISSYIEELSSSQYFTNVSLMYAQQYKNGDKRSFSVQMEVNTKARLAMEVVE